jgi:hypothetical protein
MSFLLTGAPETIFFSGDIILDSPSTAVSDFKVYMDTLYSLRKMKFDFICTTHSLDLAEGAEDHIIIPNKNHEKLEAYIYYRESRINQML